MTTHTVVLTASAILFLLVVWHFVRIVNSEKNDLEWYHLVSTKGRDGGQYADWDKIGKGVGVGLCIWLPAVYAYSDQMDAIGMGVVMAAALVYLGGVSAYSATLRSKRGGTETTTVTESQPETRTTETKSEVAP